MRPLSHVDYLQHLRSESRRFRNVLTDAEPGARVPACPEWDAADLLWHLAAVQWFWATTIRTRPTAAEHDESDLTRPDSYAGLLAAYDEYSADLIRELESADPTEPAWTWSEEQTVGFTYRRQAHEVLIHRLDAEQTVGAVTPLDPTLAADGVLECLAVMFAGTPPWGEFHPLPHHVRIDLTDTGDSLWVQLGRFTGTNPENERSYDEPDIAVVDDPGTEADAVVEGDAEGVDTWLWRRGDDAEIAVHGDRGVYDRFREIVNNPIN